MILEEEIRFLRPREDPDSWFNILVLHQNRPRRSRDRSTGAHLPESLIPTFFDLVIWGHEHECKIGTLSLFLICPSISAGSQFTLKIGGSEPAEPVKSGVLKNSMNFYVYFSYIFAPVLEVDAMMPPFHLLKISNTFASVKVWLI